MNGPRQVGPPIPAYAPEWADVFGEDDHGVFAEMELNETLFVWRWIPPGRFQMGSPPGELGRDGSEGPRHEVTLTHGFWFGETAVTQAQWKTVLGDEPSHFKGARRPVDSIDWHDCQKFLSKLNERQTGLFATLPTEAQWEYACRAGTQSAFNDGSNCSKPTAEDPALVNLGWFDKNSGGETSDVKRKQPNTWGLYDMHGNVWEWCRDGLRSYTRDPELNPTGATDEGASRVVRGGAWIIAAQCCRSACRDAAVPGNRWYFQGLRLAAGQPPEAESGAAEPPPAERLSG